MLVKNWMSEPAITVDEDDSMHDAIRIMKESNIRMLPVMKTGQIVGVLTDRDVRKASASDATTLEIHELVFLLAQIKIKDIMTKDPVTVPIDYTVEETAQKLLERKISGAPVVDQTGQIVGVITQIDLFKAVISLTGVGVGHVQFAFQLEDRSGSIKEVCDVIRGHGGRIVSILTSYENVQEGYRKVYVRIYGVEGPQLQELKKALKEKSTVLYFVDQDENIREIY